MKQCSRCNIDKGFEYFGKNKKSKDGFSSWCKPCRKVYDKKWLEQNPTKRKEYDLRNKYKTDIEYISSLVAKQNNKCAICFDEFSSSFNIDHNHETGEVRGLLCWACNTALGKFKDNPMYVKNAYQYLIEKGHYG